AGHGISVASLKNGRLSKEALVVLMSPIRSGTSTSTSTRWACEATASTGHVQEFSKTSATTSTGNRSSGSSTSELITAAVASSPIVFQASHISSFWALSSSTLVRASTRSRWRSSSDSSSVEDGSSWFAGSTPSFFVGESSSSSASTGSTVCSCDCSSTGFCSDSCDCVVAAGDDLGSDGFSGSLQPLVTRNAAAVKARATSDDRFIVSPYCCTSDYQHPSPALIARVGCL